jgi:hypothetical protein
LAALANGQVAIFARSATDGEWDLSAYWLLELAPPTVAVRCLTRVHSTVWAAFRNKIAVIDPESLRVEVNVTSIPTWEFYFHLFVYYFFVDLFRSSSTEGKSNSAAVLGW